MPFFKDLRRRSRASFRTNGSGDSTSQGEVASTLSTMSAQSSPSPVKSAASSSNFTNASANGTTTPQPQPSLRPIAVSPQPKSSSMTVSWPLNQSCVGKLLTISKRMVSLRSTDLPDRYSRQLPLCLALSQSPRTHGSVSNVLCTSSSNAC